MLNPLRGRQKFGVMARIGDLLHAKFHLNSGPNRCIVHSVCSRCARAAARYTLSWAGVSRASARATSCGDENLVLITIFWYSLYMASNTSISLDDHFADFLFREVETGRYRSASEVVRAGLRLLEDRETQMAALREALIAGEASGVPEPFDFDAFIAAKRS